MSEHRPTTSDHTWGLPQRGDTRGLGKPIRVSGKWRGTSRCDIERGRTVFRRFDEHGNEIGSHYRGGGAQE